MDFAVFTPFVISLLLHMVRVGAFFAVTPLFGRGRDSRILRIVLSLAVGAMLWSVGDMQAEAPQNMLALGVMVLREAVVGFALGFSFAVIYSMLTMAGEVISMEMGFSMARTINPETGANATVVSQLLQVLGTLMVFQLDLHHDALLIVRQTFDAVPVGQPFDYEPIWDGLRALVTGSIQLGMQFAMPVIGIMLLLSAGTVLIGRAVPSINMMEFAFALRIMTALAVLGFFLVEGMPFIVSSFESLIAHTAGIFGG